ncbi:MAG: hypothetical protein ACP5OG_04780 [Candidatus Nanoarchaeia archaeon]
MEVDEILKKYSKKIEGEIRSEEAHENNSSEMNYSNEYLAFKSDMMPELSRYESFAKNLGSKFKVGLASKDKEKLQKDLDSAHMEVLAEEVAGLALFGFVAVFFSSLLFGFALWLFGLEFPFMFVFLMFFASIFIFYYFYSMPSRLAIKWRLKAGSQMVPAVLYTVIYMRHTSNLERAISFVASHIEAPLALDFKKILWNVQTGKYSSIKDSLDAYLESWRGYNNEFIESFHLIESSLYEPSETRRIQILERALKVILDGVYEKMLSYSHNIKSPLTNLYMLGIVLPTLLLALLPLASVMMSGAIKWTHIFVLFNILIPFGVFYLTTQIMLKRPEGYGETNLLEKNPLYYQYISKSAYFNSALICIPLFLIGIIPILAGYTPIPDWLGIANDFSLANFLGGVFGSGNFFEFYEIDGKTVGPFGFGAVLLSLFVPISIALFFSLAYSKRTKELIKTRTSSKELEKEFTSSLFTLANRIGDGTPTELAFSKVAESTKGQKTENFFRIVTTNIQSMGMGIEEAIFNNKRGALLYYPSSLISTSMRILVESSKKGLNVAAQSLISISEYVGNVQKINERLRDLLAEVVSDMKSNMTFLAPLLAGIVVGLSTMITAIVVQLKNISLGGEDLSLAGMTSISKFTEMFTPEAMIPPYFMQIAIGIYIIQIIFILTSTLVTVDSGEDRLSKTYQTSKNLFSGALLYLITAFLSIVTLSVLAGYALGGLVG